jgi:hypothetical protein
MSDDPRASLLKYFTVQDEKRSWKLRCNKCSSTLRLQKPYLRAAPSTCSIMRTPTVSTI